MKRRGVLYKKTAVAILILAMIAGILLPVLAGLMTTGVSTTGTDNTDSLMATGLTRLQAERVVSALEEEGCGTLTGIQVDDVGDGYTLTMFEEGDNTYIARLDYYGNLLTLTME